MTEWRCVCLVDNHPWRLWESCCTEQPLLWKMWVHSFTWSFTTLPHVLLSLLACQVHHNALGAELHQPCPRGQGGDAGGGVPVQDEDRTWAWTPPPGRLPGRISCPGSLHPRIFYLKRDSTIIFEKQNCSSKVLDYSTWKCKRVHTILRERWFKSSEIEQFRGNGVHLVVGLCLGSTLGSAPLAGGC